MGRPLFLLNLSNKSSTSNKMKISITHPSKGVFSDPSLVDNSKIYNP
jgi:hypothetical protein